MRAPWKTMLTTVTYVPNQDTHDFKDDVTNEITGTGYTAGGVAISPLTSLYTGISDQQSTHRYAPGKWTIRQVASHINDSERVFSFRAFWFARGYDAPMPGFDQDVAVNAAGADERSWQSHVDEFRAVRSATLAFLNALPAGAWARRGVASDNPVTVRALAYIVAGHATHHAKILREKYLRS
jgi:hypothetical protein